MLLAERRRDAPCSFEDVKKLVPNYRDAVLVLVPLLPPSP
jgi:hypothetical protein